MKKLLFSTLMTATLAVGMPAVAQTASCCGKPVPVPVFDLKDMNRGWQLAWHDEFDGNQIDTASWGKCTRGKVDWNRQMSSDPALFSVADGVLTLRGIVNPDTQTDPVPFLTGGVWTKDKVAFAPGGYIEIRAKMQGAKGAWPAIWMLPFDTTQRWPDGGEVDISERLNFDDFTFQTVHSPYTVNLGRTANPQSSHTAPIDPTGYNTYGVQILQDKVVFFINGKKTSEYPKINDGAEGQYPYYRPMYLLIDMQLGGQWVGKVNPADLPTDMQIDYVRYYQYKPGK